MARPVNDTEGSPADSSGETLDVLTSQESISGETADVGRGRHAAPVSVRRRTPLRWVLEIAVVSLVAILAALAVRTFIVSPVSITNDAMAQTLVAGDRVLVSAWASTPSRGEVVAFNVPEEWAPASPDAQDGWAARIQQAFAFIGVVAPNDESLMVLRVIAVEGQRIACCTETGQLELDGVPLVEPYLRPGVATDQVSFDVVVPASRVFVLGDDRAAARDSRYHLAFDDGTISMGDVTGRVLMVAWPLDSLAPVDIETGSAG